jgi:hypothetical protein
MSEDKGLPAWAEPHLRDIWSALDRCSPTEHVAVMRKGGKVSVAVASNADLPPGGPVMTADVGPFDRWVVAIDLHKRGVHVDYVPFVLRDRPQA